VNRNKILELTLLASIVVLSVAVLAGRFVR
jgi:hypothetical protein